MHRSWAPVHSGSALCSLIKGRTTIEFPTHILKGRLNFLYFCPNRIDKVSPSLALLLWFTLLLALLRFDPAKERGISLALWVPVIWIFIVATRLPSQWLGAGMGQVAEAMQEGNALDRTIYSLLILLALGILMSRSFEWGRFCVANLALTALLSFALLSVLWSDFPFVAFKRWFRDLGTYLVILVALSDPRGFEAVRTLLRRLYFLLIPLCLLLNKYFPAMAKMYDPWTGQGYFMGATTSKNMLGVLCLVSALFFLWDTLTRWGDRKERRTRWILGVNVALFAMTLQLLSQAGSATSNVCFVLGCGVIAAAHSKTVKRRPARLAVLIPVAICLYLLLEFGLQIDTVALVSEAVGRNRDLTGRTHIWSVVLSANTNPYVGTGYESFWLGSRLLWVWEQAGWINEAHNGYLEVYLNQGLIGLFLLAGFLIASYRTICRRLRASASLGSLSLALWTVLLFYNGTESAFGGQLLWVVFLLQVITVPGRGERSPAEGGFARGAPLPRY
jgi:exopolysaccharide production protein ExoQ